MKAGARNFSILIASTVVVAAALSRLAPPNVGLAASACANPASAQALSYPGFCSIPPAPKNVRDATAFRAAVVDTRLEGARLVRRTAPDTFTLNGTDDFLNQARRDATPPPPLTTPSRPDTEAFVREMRARATPPPKPH